MVKRIGLHILFWICFFALFAYINILWDRSTFPHAPLMRLIKTSITAAFFELIPQIVFSYYLIYRAINNIVKKKFNIIYNIFEITIVLFLCMLMYRMMDNYITIPYIYKAPQLIHPLLEPMRVTVAMLDIIFAFGLMLCIKSVRVQLAAKEREKNLIKEKLETELKFLKNQTNPHFLLNTLNNIYALARKKSDDTAEAVMRLSELLRFILYESNGSLIKLTDEIKVLEDYLELEAMRYSERLTVSFEKEIENDLYQITPLLLLPFIENAFKHGISETRFESFIYINIKVKNGILNFEIENSKDETACSNSTANIGLINVKRQLELTYSDYKLDVQNEDNIYKVHLTINLSSYVEI